MFMRHEMFSNNKNKDEIDKLTYFKMINLKRFFFKIKTNYKKSYIYTLVNYDLK